MTLGGKRGLSQAYYLPSMSAMQLFLPAGAHEGIGAHRPPYQLYSHEADWGPRWSPHMRPLAELFEQARFITCVMSSRSAQFRIFFIAWSSLVLCYLDSGFWSMDTSIK